MKTLCAHAEGLRRVCVNEEPRGAQATGNTRLWVTHGIIIRCPGSPGKGEDGQPRGVGTQRLPLGRAVCDERGTVVVRTRR